MAVYGYWRKCFDGNYDTVEENNRIQEFERKITDKTLSIEVNADREKFCEAVDYLENVAEKILLMLLREIVRRKKLSEMLADRYNKRQMGK